MDIITNGPPRCQLSNNNKVNNFKEEIIIDSGNVTHFTNFRHCFVKRDCDVFLAQEHKLRPQDRAEARREIGDRWKVHFSNLDPDADGPSAGVSYMCPKNKHIITPEAKSEHFKSFNAKGRVQVYALEVDTDVCPGVQYLRLVQCQ